MISALTGQLKRVETDRAYLACGPMVYELMVPAADMAALEAAVGAELTFHTIFYIEGDAGGGGLEPRLIGFLQVADKRFFEKFITVKGIGPKKALRAFAFSSGEIAAAIENRDVRFLIQLPAIGKRMADQIVAELAGKVQSFVGVNVSSGGRVASRGGRHSVEEEDAISALMALGERREAAVSLLERAKSVEPTPSGAQALIREMLRLRSSRG